MAWPADTNRSHPYLVTLAVLMAALLWQGCAMTPALPVTDAAESLPDTYDTVLFQSDEASEEAAMESPAMPTAEPITLWWQEWGDARLDLIVDSVLVANADIRMAAARVLEVQEAFRISRSARLPMVQATADGSRQNTPTNIGATGRFSESIPGFPDRFDVTQYSASLGLAWELDFWGKARASSKAAFSQFVATAAEYEAARIGVVSETISAYFELLDVREQIRLADEQLSLLDERLEVTSDRYRRGLVSSFEWYGLQQQTDEAKAARPMLDVQYVTARGRLAVLLGGSAETGESLIDMEGAPLASGAHFPDVLPSELVRGRPDVAAAAARLETARQMVGVRRAEQF
ncbi:MAG: TolC family protein, partial [Bacteroidota bacterium]|nr:TolC family protein [Bacteroidota bacterium]